MIDRDPDGFVTLHKPRESILVKVIRVLVLLLALVMFLKWSEARAQQAMPALNPDTGECRCFANGKDWPCRRVKGDLAFGLQAVNRCHGGGYQLQCPADKQGVCQYVMLPPTCTEPPLSNVCWMGDEPK